MCKHEMDSASIVEHKGADKIFVSSLQVIQNINNASQAISIYRNI